jgi:hypothetical protein
LAAEARAAELVTADTCAEQAVAVVLWEAAPGSDRAADRAAGEELTIGGEYAAFAEVVVPVLGVVEQVAAAAVAVALPTLV